jgi:hypothetical protein
MYVIDIYPCKCPKPENSILDVRIEDCNFNVIVKDDLRELKCEECGRFMIKKLY